MTESGQMLIIHMYMFGVDFSVILEILRKRFRISNHKNGERTTGSNSIENAGGRKVKMLEAA